MRNVLWTWPQYLTTFLVTFQKIFLAHSSTEGRSHDLGKNSLELMVREWPNLETIQPFRQLWSGWPDWVNFRIGIGRLYVIFWAVLFFTEGAQIFELRFSSEKAMNWFWLKNCLGYILCDFFTNSSGQAACDTRVNPTYDFRLKQGTTARDRTPQDRTLRD
jgi:hypothetical protein